MKRLTRYLTLAAVAAMLAMAPSVWAESCCKKAADAAKNGKACEKCLAHACCKEAAEKAAKDGKAKPCEKCTAKKEKAEKKS